MEVGQYFGSVNGSLNINEEMMNVQLHSQYGPDKANAHSISLNLETSNSGEHAKKKYEGQFFLEVRAEKLARYT